MLRPSGSPSLTCRFAPCSGWCGCHRTKELFDVEMEIQISGAREALVRNRLSSIRLGDSRLTRRLNLVVRAIEQKPAASFPKIFPSKAELDAFYRFVNNERVSS